MTYHVSFGFILDYWRALLAGLSTTLELTGTCVVLGVLLGFVLSLMRTSESRVIYAISSVYVEFFRGTPVLIQIFWIFFCLPVVLHIDIGNLASAIIEGDDEPAAYNLFHIDGSPGAWQCEMAVRGLRAGHEGVVELKRERLR